MKARRAPSTFLQACETPNSLGARRAPENARQRKPPLTRAASRAHRDARRLSHIPLASLSIFYHPFTMSRDSLHSLYDVPGTGFRDREDGPMYSQYHKIGWQADWKPKDNPDNRYYMCNNPVVIDNIPASVNQAAIRAACETFGAVVRVHRPEGHAFAIVEFESDDSADDAIKVGVDFPDAREGTAPRPSVGPRKHLTKDIAAWRREIRTKYAAVAAARSANPDADPTHHDARRRRVADAYPNLVRAS